MKNAGAETTQLSYNDFIAMLLPGASDGEDGAGALELLEDSPEAPAAAQQGAGAPRTKLTKELTELIDREADLLNRGRGDKALEGLRKRITRAFLQLIRDPSYNPEASNLVNPIPL